MSNTSSPTKVGIKKGTFYLSQDGDGGQGWEKQEFKNPQTNEPMVKYHKNISLEGDLVYIGHKEDKFKGNCLTILLKSESDTFSLEIPVLDAKGVKATNQYFNSLVGSLEILKKGDKIKMFINNKNEDKNGNLYKNVVTLREDNSLVKSVFEFKDVPKWLTTVKKDAFGKEVTEYDPTPTNDFYISKFLKIVEDFKLSNPKQDNTTQTTTKQETAPYKGKQEMSEHIPDKEGFDKLPF
jgi:hypothetical protein